MLGSRFIPVRLVREKSEPLAWRHYSNAPYVQTRAKQTAADHLAQQQWYGEFLKKRFMNICTQIHVKQEGLTSSHRIKQWCGAFLTKPMSELFADTFGLSRPSGRRASKQWRHVVFQTRTYDNDDE